MKRKTQFLKAVRLLAPKDFFINKAARQIREDELPSAPGGVALELVSALHWLRQELKAVALILDRASRHHRPTSARLTGQSSLPLEQALRVKSAEYWLKLGQPVEAMAELNRLPEGARKDPWVLKVTTSAIGAARQLGECLVRVE